MAENKPTIEIDPLGTVGSTGLQQWGGWINEEHLRELRGRNGVRTYNEMRRNSSSVAMALRVTDIVIRSVKWRVDPAIEDDEEAQKQADDTAFALFEDMSQSWNDFISEILSMLWAGFAPFEIIWKQRRGEHLESKFRSKKNDGLWAFRKLSIRSQDTVWRWVFDDEGGIAGLEQQDVYNNTNKGVVFIPIEKMLLFRTDVFKNNPEGMSLLRPAYLPYFYIKRIQQFEGIGIERNTAGLVYMTVPPEILDPNADDDTKALRKLLEQIITNIRVDTYQGGLFPAEVNADGKNTGFALKTLGGGDAKKVQDTDVVIQRYKKEILQLFLAQFLQMGMDKVGSFSLANSATDMFALSVSSIMDQIAEVVNHFLIPRRQKLNGVDSKYTPKLVHGDIEEQGIKEIGAFVKDMVAVGAIPTGKALARHLLGLAGLPELDEEELEAEPAPPKLPPELMEGLLQAIKDKKNPVPPVEEPVETEPEPKE